MKNCIITNTSKLKEIAINKFYYKQINKMYNSINNEVQ